MLHGRRRRHSHGGTGSGSTHRGSDARPARSATVHALNAGGALYDTFTVTTVEGYDGPHQRPERCDGDMPQPRVAGATGPLPDTDALAAPASSWACVLSTRERTERSASPSLLPSLPACARAPSSLPVAGASFFPSRPFSCSLEANRSTTAARIGGQPDALRQRTATLRPLGQVVWLDVFSALLIFLTTVGPTRF